MDLLKTLLATAKDRLKNPIIGSFIFLWIAFNWKPIMIILFSSKSIEERISHVTKEYTEIWYLIPLILALLYILLTPYVMWIIDFLLNKGTEGRKHMKNESIKSDLDREIEIIQKKKELEKLTTEHTNLKESNEELEKLRLDLLTQDKIIVSLKDDISNIIPLLKEPEHLTDNERSIWDKKFDLFKANYLDMFPRILTIHFGNSELNGFKGPEIGKLEEVKIIEANTSKTGGNHYQLTPMGKYFINRYKSSLMSKYANIRSNI
jgi:hypothetical protein